MSRLIIITADGFHADTILSVLERHARNAEASTITLGPDAYHIHDTDWTPSEGSSGAAMIAGVV